MAEQTQYTGMDKKGDATYTPKEPNSENTVVITQPTKTVPEEREPTIEERPSAVLPIVLSCFVAWCCCPCIGIAAFICAIYAGTKEDHAEYREKLSLSKKLSIAGIIIGVIIIIINVIVRVTQG